MNRNFLTAGAEGRYTRTGLVSTLLATVAVTGMIATADAANLTQEQRALVAKYRISEEDQQKLFGSQPGASRQAVPAKSAMPVKVAPPPPPPARTFVAPYIPFLSTTILFVSLDTYKGLGERITNINGGEGALTGSFGVTGGFNTGYEFLDSSIGVQGGASWGTYDPRGRMRLIPQATEHERQTYYTAGVYRRGDMSVGTFLDRISAAVVYDHFKARQWGVNANDISLSQVRYLVGFAVLPSTELGVWGTNNIDTDRAAVTVAGAPGVRTTIHAMRQTNLYVKHNFDFGGQVMAYWGKLGPADIIGKWVAGMTAQAPLSPSWAAFANANYVMSHFPAGPVGSGREQFSATVGIAYYFGGNAQSPTVSGSKGLPMLDVASNRTFLISP